MQNDTMNGQSESKPVSLDLGLIYHVIFRQKWKLLVCLLAGVLAAAGCFVSIPPLYQSKGKLMLRFIQDAPSINAAEGTGAVTIIDSRAEIVINSEVQLLGSLNILKTVAERVGAERVLAAVGGGTNVQRAAVYLAKHLSVRNPLKTTIVELSLRHPDPEIAQEAQTELVLAYLEKHREIHGQTVADEYLYTKTEQVRQSISETQKRYRDELKKAGVLSVEQGEKLFSSKITKYRDDITQANIELKTSKATLEHSRGAVSREDENGEPLTPEQIAKEDEYRETITLLDSFRSKWLEYSTRYTPSHPIMISLREQKEEQDKKKREMEAEEPGLKKIGLPSVLGAAPGFDTAQAAMNIAGLEAKVRELGVELTNTLHRAEAFEVAKPILSELELTLKAEESRYERLMRFTQAGKYDDLAGYQNIKVVEEATPPSRDIELLKKALAISLGAGLILGVGLALLSELILDQTVKRPVEIESGLRLPLFLTIPRLKRRQLAKQDRMRKRLRHSEDSGPELTPLEASLQPFFAALRDRTVMYLERLTHKPKLVAVTGCGEDSGVSTVASGLAKALSETAEGRVLLVDMNHEIGATHPFADGKPVRGLTDVLEGNLNGQAQDNLVVATTAEGNQQALTILPKRFASLVPKLKASDYDYVIFDMPPATSLSVTPRLAGLMDVVLLVVEAEKSPRAAVKRAHQVLQESKANVRTVLNKHRTYVPQWLYQEP